MNQKSFPKSHRLLNSKDFASLRGRDVEKIHYKTFKLIYRRVDTDSSRLGFAVSRKVGKAVVRNHIKRLLREWFRQVEFKGSSYDLLIIVHPKYKLFGREAFLKKLKTDLDKLYLIIST